MMRTINTNKEEEEVSFDVGTPEGDSTLITLMDADRQPCWYIEVNKNSQDHSWKIGVKSRNHNEEYEFKSSEISKSRNDETTEIIDAQDFPIKLLDKFKAGGKKAVRDWFKNGCR